MPDETCGSILHGLICAWTLFGAVPVELWCDNPKTLAQAIWRGRDRRLNPNFAALASHYRFAVLKDLETYDFTTVPGLSKQKVLELARDEWIDQKFNACFIGNAGTGKTHLASGTCSRIS